MTLISDYATKQIINQNGEKLNLDFAKISNFFAMKMLPIHSKLDRKSQKTYIVCTGQKNKSENVSNHDRSKVL